MWLLVLIILNGQPAVQGMEILGKFKTYDGCHQRRLDGVKITKPNYNFGCIFVKSPCIEL